MPKLGDSNDYALQVSEWFFSQLWNTFNCRFLRNHGLVTFWADLNLGRRNCGFAHYFALHFSYQIPTHTSPESKSESRKWEFLFNFFLALPSSLIKFPKNPKMKVIVNNKKRKFLPNFFLAPHFCPIKFSHTYYLTYPILWTPEKN